MASYKSGIKWNIKKSHISLFKTGGGLEKTGHTPLISILGSNFPRGYLLGGVERIRYVARYLI